MEIGGSTRISERAGLYPRRKRPARNEFDGPRDFEFPTPFPGKVEENNTVYGWLYRCEECWQERPTIILLDGGFPTPRPCEFAENNVVHGWLYRCAHAWQERPTIVFLHGASDVPGHQLGFNLFARRFQRAGFNAATLELPYHFQRRPSQYGPGISQDYLQMAKTYAQAVAEIRSLSGWLLAEGCPAVALAGGSLGAYLAGLTACRDMRLASIVMALSVARMGDLVSQAEQALGRRAREVVRRRRAAFEALDKTPFKLTSTRPAISKENVVLIEGMHDLLASSPVELWQSWGQPEIWRLPHGHISTALISLMPGLRAASCAGWRRG
jgi:pimeloyl-ACP methyl ester carboxylesterase